MDETLGLIREFCRGTRRRGFLCQPSLGGFEMVLEARDRLFGKDRAAKLARQARAVFCQHARQ